MKKNNKDFYYILKKKCLNHTISKNDGQINISILDMQSELQDIEETKKRLNETFETLDKMLLQDGHKKIIESDYYNVYTLKNDSSELFVLQNKDTCVTLIELI